jgi:hypothetical protein
MDAANIVHAGLVPRSRITSSEPNRALAVICFEFLRARGATLDDDFKKLDWGVPDERKPTLTNEEAMIIAVSTVATALENIAFQIHQMIGPVQGIADKRERDW